MKNYSPLIVFFVYVFLALAKNNAYGGAVLVGVLVDNQTKPMNEP